MRPKEGKRVEHTVELRVDRGDAAAYWRGERRPPDTNLGGRKELADAPKRDPAHIGVPRVVVGEVVPDDAPPLVRELPHPVRELFLVVDVEQRGENGRLHDDVERLFLEGKCRGVAGQDAARRRKSVAGGV